MGGCKKLRCALRQTVFKNSFCPMLRGFWRRACRFSYTRTYSSLAATETLGRLVFDDHRSVGNICEPFPTRVGSLQREVEAERRPGNAHVSARHLQAFLQFMPKIGFIRRARGGGCRHDQQLPRGVVQRFGLRGHRQQAVKFRPSRKAHFPSPQTRGTFLPSPSSTLLPRRGLVRRRTGGRPR